MTPGIIAWHRSKALIVLDDVDGTAIVDSIYCNGFVSEENVLTRGDVYTITGPFGQDNITGKAMVQHTVASHVNIGPFPETHLALVRHARITGIGTVESVIFEEGSCAAMPWNAIVSTVHDYFNPLRNIRIDFKVIYCFGLYTPLPSFWKDLAVGSRIWVNATLVGKDRLTSNYIAEIEQFSAISSYSSSNE
ncbi:hypothetical protein DFH28DRAFT_926107 [Melampsora americana]|nr:hypothetical protein DFH28DRAFT_927422 [Melampsora americana]KAH9817903.1 hypothetical protein DFH28DRAFT_926107 [Melampsora americana]